MEKEKPKLTTQDTVNVLRAGVVEPSEFENGSWRHRVKTNNICVVVVFVSEEEGSSGHGLEDSTMTRCVACGEPVKTRREPRYRYVESGLPNVELENVVTTTTCTKCGETYTGIPAIEDLHRKIAAAIIRKKGRLAPEEVRFLRKLLGWSGTDFAKRMGTQPETVSRWEHGKAAMGPQADRLLRLLVARETPVTEYPVDVLSQVAAHERSTKPVKVEMERGPGGWAFRPGPALVKTG
jgi:putative zinc finger/helix-turn-helix YgiT family protein